MDYYIYCNHSGHALAGDGMTIALTMKLVIGIWIVSFVCVVIFGIMEFWND